MKSDIILIDDPFDHTQPTEQQKENLRKFCGQVLRDWVNPPKNSSDNPTDTDKTKTVE